MIHHIVEEVLTLHNYSQLIYIIIYAATNITTVNGGIHNMGIYIYIYIYIYMHAYHMLQVYSDVCIVYIYIHVHLG